jgi:hypothetical protein
VPELHLALFETSALVLDVSRQLTGVAQVAQDCQPIAELLEVFRQELRDLVRDAMRNKIETRQTAGGSERIAE